MAFNKFDLKVAGSKKQASEPRLAGEILLNDILFSNEHPLGISYHHRMMFDDIFSHTGDALLKMLMQTSGKPSIGAMLDRAFFYDADDHHNNRRN